MRWLALLILPLLAACPSSADEKDELIAKQKMTALERMKKFDNEKPVVVETENLILCGNLEEDKLKATGEMVQKHYALALKALKFEMSDNPPKGKIAVLLFPDRKQYVLLVGDLTNDRVEKDDRSHSDGRGDTPWVAVSVLPGGKPTDLDVEASGQIAVALLQNKAGNARLSSWMRDGFAKAVLMRSNPGTASTDRATIRRVLAEAKGKPAKYKVSDIWASGGDPDKRVLAASLMEYFVFGSGGPTFAKLLSNLLPVEGTPNPTIDFAIKAAEIKPEELDRAWKKWVATGK